MALAGIESDCLGQGLTIHQRLAVKTSLLKLKVNEKLSMIDFWGRITTASQNDYLILAAYDVKDKIKKTFYWSNDNGLSFAKLDDLSQDQWAMMMTMKLQRLFTGNPSKKYHDPDHKTFNEDGEEEEVDSDADEAEDEAADDDNNDETTAKKQKQRKLTELERLSITIRMIDDDCHLLPKGLLFMTNTGDIVQNQQFKGITSEQSQSLSYYYHFRQPINPSTLASIRKHNNSNNYDFLDVVSNDGSHPSQWAVHSDDSQLITSIRSLSWPGYEYRVDNQSSSSSSFQHHNVTSNINIISRFGGSYYGTGLKNADLMFML